MSSPAHRQLASSEGYSTRSRSLIVMPGATTRNASANRLSFGLRRLLRTCHAISMDITTVFPLPVAILHAMRNRSVPASVVACLRCSSIQVCPYFDCFATSVTKISVSRASIWQKNSRRSRCSSVQWRSSASVVGVVSGHPSQRNLSADSNEPCAQPPTGVRWGHDGPGGRGATGMASSNLITAGSWVERYGATHRWARFTAFPVGIVPPQKVRVYRRADHFLLNWWDPAEKKNLSERVSGDLLAVLARARQIDERVTTVRRSGIGATRRLAHADLVQKYLADLGRRADAGEVDLKTVRRYQSALSHFTDFAAQHAQDERDGEQTAHGD